MVKQKTAHPCPSANNTLLCFSEQSTLVHVLLLLLLLQQLPLLLYHCPLPPPSIRISGVPRSSTSYSYIIIIIIIISSLRAASPNRLRASCVEAHPQNRDFAGVFLSAINTVNYLFLQLLLQLYNLRCAQPSITDVRAASTVPPSSASYYYVYFILSTFGLPFMSVRCRSHAPGRKNQFQCRGGELLPSCCCPPIPALAVTACMPSTPPIPSRFFRCAGARYADRLLCLPPPSSTPVPHPGPPRLPPALHPVQRAIHPTLLPGRSK